MKVLKFIAVLIAILGVVITGAAVLSLAFPENAYFHLARESITAGALLISAALNFSLMADLRKAKGLN